MILIFGNRSVGCTRAQHQTDDGVALVVTQEGVVVPPKTLIRNVPSSNVGTLLRALLSKSRVSAGSSSPGMSSFAVVIAVPKTGGAPSRTLLALTRADATVRSVRTRSNQGPPRRTQRARGLRVIYLRRCSAAVGRSLAR